MKKKAEARRVDAQQVQADEIWVKMVGRKVWMALAMAVPSRLRLGRVVSAQRDGELLNAAFRSRMAGLARRIRSLLRRERMLRTGMYLVGCVYNFCTPHRSLRAELPAGRRKWRACTPAMAAGLTDHIWTVPELLHYPRPSPTHQPLPLARETP